jgi:glycosyltransferase involved in cell wall biosynthesis
MSGTLAVARGLKPNEPSYATKPPVNRMRASGHRADRAHERKDRGKVAAGSDAAHGRESVTAEPTGSRVDRQHMRTLALLHWGHVIEDFLDNNALSLEDFSRKFTGSWMFGYVEALKAAGVRTLLVCISRDVREVTLTVHTPTGADLVLLPAPRSHRLLRKVIVDPYGRTVRQSFGGPRAVRLLLYPLLAALKEAAPYLATPVWKLARELRREGCEALLCQEYEFPRFDVCVLLGKVMKLRIFAVFQGGDYQRWKLERLMRPWSIRACTGLVIGSGVEVQRVRDRYSVDSRKIRRIANPIDTETWRPGGVGEARQELGIPAQARVAAWHGRVQLPKKGLDILVDAWARVCAERPGAELRLLLIGSGADTDAVRSRLDGHRLRNVVWVERYLHDRSEIRDLLLAADVYAFSSRHEGFPVALVEAMACGLPVVATDVGGVRDILPAGERSGGVVVPPRDPVGFAAALGRLLDDESLAQALGKLSRERAKEFGFVTIGRELRSFFF